MKDKILCIIPARGGSKGVIKKNIRLLCKKPLISHTIDEAKKSKLIDKIVISSDDEDILRIGKNLLVDTINRPKNLAQDKSSTIDVIYHAIDRLKEEGYLPDYILLLQCTSPLRTVEHIDEAINKFLNNKNKYDSLISVSKQEHPPWWLKKIDTDGGVSDFLEYDKQKYTRRQDFEELYFVNGAIYIAKIDKLYEFNDFETSKTLSYIMDSRYSLDIDNEIDFLTAEFLMNQKY